MKYQIYEITRPGFYYSDLRLNQAKFNIYGYNSIEEALKDIKENGCKSVTYTILPFIELN